MNKNIIEGSELCTNNYYYKKISSNSVREFAVVYEDTTKILKQYTGPLIMLRIDATGDSKARWLSKLL